MTATAYSIVRQRVLDAVEAGDIDSTGARDSVRAGIAEVVRGYQTEAHTADSHPALGDVDGMIERVLTSVVDFGPLTELLLRRDDVEEILVQGSRLAYITADGKTHFLATTATEAELRQYVERLLQTATSDGQLDASHPMESVGLPGSARLSAKISPVAELTVAIRKPVAARPTLRQLVAGGSMSPPAAGLLAMLMRARCRVVVAGPPKAGKTHLVKALLAAIPADRVVRVNQEAPELDTPLMLGGYAQASDRPGQTLRDLIKADLRFRPDVLVVGEVLGAEAVELLRPLNAGVGFLTTVHANQASEAIDALAVAANQAGGGLELVELRGLFARHIDFVVFVDVDEFTDDGVLRRELMEISWIDPELRSGQVVHEPIFRRDELGLPLEWTGAKPREDVTRRLERSLRGVSLKSVLAGETTVGDVI